LLDCKQSIIKIDRNEHSFYFNNIAEKQDSFKNQKIRIIKTIFITKGVDQYD